MPPFETPDSYVDYDPAACGAKIGWKDPVQESVTRVHEVDISKGVGMLASGICMWLPGGERVTFTPVGEGVISASLSAAVDPLHDPSAR